jgi:hypothetical protein
MWAWRILVLAGLTGVAQPPDWAKRPLFPVDSTTEHRAEFRTLVETRCESFDGRRRYDAVTFGHFLSPKSEDAVVGTSGCEPHSLLFGGSFLLTKREGKWVSLGYHSGVITNQCHKLSTGSGVDFLLCSHVLGAQGSVSRVLRAYDFRTPKRPRILISLAVWNEMRAHDVDAFPVAEQGVIESVSSDDLDGDGLSDISIVARAGRVERTAAERQRFIESRATWAPPLRVPVPGAVGPTRSNTAQRNGRARLPPAVASAADRFTQRHRAYSSLHRHHAAKLSQCDPPYC